MKTVFSVLFYFLLLSCSNNKDILFEDANNTEHINGDGGEYDEVLHDKIRTQPYPRSTHELYFNPPPLIVPTSMGIGGDKNFKLLFELSQDKNFTSEKTIKSKELPWGMFNVHRALETGNWYWRFKRTNQDEWSDVYTFTVKDDLETFVTPGFDVFKKNIPQSSYPRLFAFLNDALDAVYDSDIRKHREYKDFQSRASKTFEEVIEEAGTDNGVTFYSYITSPLRFWYDAYLLTQDQIYFDKLLKAGKHIAQIGIIIDDAKKNNGVATNVMNTLSYIYDVCYDKLSANERTVIEKGMIEIIQSYYNMYRGGLECHIFENHVMQYIMMSMLRGCFLLYDKYPIANEALEYYYEHWTARCPAGGFNRDGGWFNGTGYFVTNFETLWYCPMLFSYYTDSNFLDHPWYKNCGKALVYSQPPYAGSSGFGDTSTFWGNPNRQRLAFADFIAREVNDTYAQWYIKTADSERNILSGDYAMRIYRIPRSVYCGDLPSPELPEDDGNYVWYKDMGEGVITSDLNNLSESVTLSFLSSPYASGSHTNPHQNSFNIAYGGRPIYVRNGYYSGAGELHHLMWQNNTRGCNSMLINGVSQALNNSSYGNIMRGLNNDCIGYFLGDASSAYSSSCDDAWAPRYEKYGIQQIEEDGFGPTPLTRYRRHIFLLRPDKVVIYDDLEASSPVQWDWLLHSTHDMKIDNANNKFESLHIYKEGEGTFANMEPIKAVTQQFCNQTPSIFYTDEYYGAPTTSSGGGKGEYFHLKISYGKSLKNRILTIMQFAPEDKSIEEIKGTNGDYTVGEWKILVNLDEDKPTSITITNENKHTLFNYGDGDINFDGQSYTRKNARSSILYDAESGFQEMKDRNPMPTRAGKFE